MKTYTECIIGNTAVKIAMTNRKIKVINVERQYKIRHFLINTIVIIMLSIFLVGCCTFIIQRSSQNVLLEKEIASLNTQIGQLEKEVDDLSGLQEDIPQYGPLYKEALEELGMVFPIKSQIYYYESKKSNMIRSS